MRLIDKIWKDLDSTIEADLISINIEEIPFVLAEYIEENSLNVTEEVELSELSDFLGMRVITHTNSELPYVFQIYTKAQ